MHIGIRFQNGANYENSQSMTSEASVRRHSRLQEIFSPVRQERASVSSQPWCHVAVPFSEIWRRFLQDYRFHYRQDPMVHVTAVYRT